MTIQASNNRVQYTADGTTTVFPVPFKYIEDSKKEDIKVYQDDNLIPDTEYSFSGNGQAITGQITFNAPPTTGAITIIRSLKVTQLLDLIETGNFSAEAIEAAFDRLTLICQDLSEIQTRTIRSKIKNQNFNGELPDPLADRYLKIDPTGNKFELGKSQSEMDQILGDASGALQATQDLQSTIQSEHSTMETNFQKLYDDTVKDNDDTVVEIQNILALNTSSKESIVTSASNVDLNLSLNNSTHHSLICEYIIERGADLEFGKILLFWNGASFVIKKIDPTGNSGVSFNFSTNNGVATINYSTPDAQTGIIRYHFKKFGI